MAASGWYRDPTGFGEGRFWDGEKWTDQVINSAGVTTVGPINTGIDTPPAPGTEYRPSSGAPAQSVTVAQKSSPIGAILGALAVIVAIIALVIALSNNSDDDGGEEQPTTTTEAPAEPPEGE